MNQTTIIHVLAEDLQQDETVGKYRYKGQYLIFEDEIQFKNLKGLYNEMIQQYNVQRQRQQHKDFTIIVPEEITFLTECFANISSCTSGFNSVSEVMAQEIYKFEDLLEIFKIMNFYYPLKIQCLNLILNSYIDVHTKVRTAQRE